MEESKEYLSNRLEYAKWIKSVRKKYKYTQSTFGEMVCCFYYNNERNQRECRGYSESAVKKWESGKSRPDNTEALISMALIQESGSCERCEGLSYKERKDRYIAVQKCMSTYFERKLYCRNMNDALFVASIIGIYSVKELPSVYPKFEKIIQSVELDLEEKKKYSLSKHTENIERDLLACENEEDFKELVEKWKVFFYLGGRTVGERMKTHYEEAHREEKLTFKEAVAIYAPRTAESYNRIFSSDAMISRQWLLDLCIHLRLSRNEMEVVLKNASMSPLSKDKNDSESCLKASTYYAIGSVKWYEKRAEQGKDSYQYRYPWFLSMNLEEKMSFILLLTEYAKEKGVNNMPPIDYLLEYIPSCKIFSELCKLVQKEKLEVAVDLLDETIDEILYKIRTDAGKAVYEKYRAEFRRYYQMGKGKYNPLPKEIDKTEEGNLLTFVSAIIYSVFSGKIVSSTFREEDFKQLKVALEEMPDKFSEEKSGAYYFIRRLWKLFLTDERIFRGKRNGFHFAGELEDDDAIGLDVCVENLQELYFLSNAKKCKNL